jgi:4a-hydroxytetrahydrobiopterin dehydratase
MSQKLTPEALQTALKTLPDWRLEDGQLIRSITFSTFPQAIDFVSRIAAFAEAANHHPDMDIRYNKLRVALVTHDSGGITQKDVDLATSIETALP